MFKKSLKFLQLLAAILLTGTITAQKSAYLKAPLKRSIAPSDIKNDIYPRSYSTEAPFPGGSSYQDALLKKKAEIEKKFPKKRSLSPKRGSAAEVTLERNMGSFYGPDNNIQNRAGGVPNDNTLAVSDNGFLIASYNTRVYFHDLNGDSAYYRPHPFTSTWSFVDFALDNDSIGTSLPFDPKLRYDAVEDRFVFTFLSGRTPDDSKLVIAFSSSGDPMDDWNVYEIPGNPFNERTWSDFPVIALTENEVLYTINLIRENEPWETGFEETLIWQLDKQSGYDGVDSLPMKLWSDIKFGGKVLRNLHAMQGGDELKAPPYYLMSNRNFDASNDTFFLVSLTGEMNDPLAEVTTKHVISNKAYGLSPAAEQPAGPVLSTNDARVLDGFYENGQIQFVGNSIDTNSGRSSIYHGVLSDPSGSPSIDLNIMQHNTMEFGYPGIAYTGKFAGDNEAIIGVNYSSIVDTAGYGAFYFDPTGEYSNFTNLIQGQSYLQRQGNPERWGDYFGIQRVYSEQGSVWMSGYYGTSTKEHSFWMSEVRSPTYIFAGAEEAQKNEQTKAFPVPTQDFTYIDFELDHKQEVHFILKNMEGKTIKRYRQVLGSGMNRFECSLVNLPSGIYLLQVQGASISREHKLVRD